MNQIELSCLYSIYSFLGAGEGLYPLKPPPHRFTTMLRVHALFSVPHRCWTFDRVHPRNDFRNERWNSTGARSGLCGGWSDMSQPKFRNTCCVAFLMYRRPLSIGYIWNYSSNLTRDGPFVSSLQSAISIQPSQNGVIVLTLAQSNYRTCAELQSERCRGHNMKPKLTFNVLFQN